MDVALNFNFGGEGRLDVVNNRQFSIAFFSFFEQALRLIEESGIFEGNTHAVSEGLQQAYIRLAEGILVVEILQRDNPDNFAVDEHWHKQCGLRYLAYNRDWISILCRRHFRVLINQQRLTGFDHMLTEPNECHWFIGKAHATFDAVRETNKIFVAII